MDAHAPLLTGCGEVYPYIFRYIKHIHRFFLWGGRLACCGKKNPKWINKSQFAFTNKYSQIPMQLCVPYSPKLMLSSYIINSFTSITRSLAIIPLTLKPKGSECTAQQQILPDGKYKNQRADTVCNHCPQTTPATCVYSFQGGQAKWYLCLNCLKTYPPRASYCSLMSTWQLTESHWHVWVLHGISTDEQCICYSTVKKEDMPS